MRYQVGEQIPVIQFRLEKDPTELKAKLFSWPYLNSFELREVQEIRMDVLTVKEHHKVSWCEEPEGEKKHDGYVLQSRAGEVFHNQYPKASFGQLLDTDNYLFKRAVPDKKAKEIFHDPNVKVLEYCDLEQVVLNIFRGIRYMMRKAVEEQNNDVQTQLYDRAERLTSLYGRLKSEFERSPLFKGKTFKVYHTLVTEQDDDGKDELCSTLKFKILDKE